MSKKIIKVKTKLKYFIIIYYFKNHIMIKKYSNFRKYNLNISYFSNCPNLLINKNILIKILLVVVKFRKTKIFEIFWIIIIFICY